jgi:ABC-type arginine/histidine transport system permease subunit
MTCQINHRLAKELARITVVIGLVVPVVLALMHVAKNAVVAHFVRLDLTSNFFQGILIYV